MAAGASDLLGGVRAINIGLAGFAEPIAAAGGAVLNLDWRPPAGADRELGLILARLEDDPDDPIGAVVAEGNRQALERILGAGPVLVGVEPAGSVIPGLAGRTLLHSGPPIAWERMCGPMRGATIGAILFEGWAVDPAAAEKMAETGDVAFDSCHHHGAVGPMAGIVSPSMPVVVVANGAGGNRAFATLNEGLGKVLRFGAYDESVLARLRWFRDELGPVLGRTLAATGPLDLKSITAQALQMGDEGHNRNVAATSLLVRSLAPALVRVAPGEAEAVLDFLRGNDHFFLNLSMAACKATLDAAHGIRGSTVVTAMSRNGVEFGVRLSGTGDTWFTAPVGVPSV